MSDILSKPLSRLRAAPARGVASSGSEPAIDREGGDEGAGIIRGIAVVTRGEALGHGIWLDKPFVSSVADAINKQSTGLKARFTHPGLSSDGMGKFLGRVKDGRMDGDIARGDLHFNKAAHSTPDGDLAEYVMSLAESDPAAFATSIVFEHDRGEEDRFVAANKDEDGKFTSPDPDNAKHYTHARLKRLWADDIVDEPAANPGGLFHRGQEIPQEADALLSYALGLTTERPELVSLEVDTDRVVGFVSRFLDLHGLSVVRKENRPMAENPINGAPVPEKPAVDLSAERLAALQGKYGSDPAFVLEMFQAGRTMAEAETEWLKRENAKQAAKLAELEKECEQLKTAQPKLAAGVKPVEFAGEAASEKGGDFIERSKSLAAERRIPLHKAMSELARTEPQLHKAWLASQR